MNEIAMYIRDKKNNPFAILMMVKTDNNKIGLGFASCHKGDTFNKKKARMIAHGRALADIKGRPMKIPYCITEAHKLKFANICKKFLENNQAPITA